MRSFLAFLAVARLTSADESCTEAADETTLLQGRLLAREADEYEFAAAVPNEGTQCWHGNQCAGQGGQCPSGYCGAEGVCCRNNWTPRNAAEEEYCGDGHGNNGMHQCHPNRLTYRDVSQLPHMWQSAERSFGVEVSLDHPQTVQSVTVHSDWWMKRPDLVAVYATDQAGATHKLAEFEYGGSLDICSGGSGRCSYPDDGAGSATSQRTVDINSDVVATSVRVQVVTPRNANGQPNGQVIIKDVSVNPDCRLSAYWEYGGCGCGGNDQNQNWCGGIRSGQCPDNVETSVCPSGTAHLAEWHPKPYLGTGHQPGHAGHLTRAGCEYIWHAQYACQEPEFDCRLSAYWEYGSGGCGGNDQNQNWCGGIRSGQCPDTVQTSICASGTAYLAVWHPKPYDGTGHQPGHAGHYHRGGVEYIWHAQYACQQ